MIIISTSLTKPGQPSPRFHVDAWLPFRNCEMVYCVSILMCFFMHDSIYCDCHSSFYFLCLISFVFPLYYSICCDCHSSLFPLLLLLIIVDSFYLQNCAFNRDENREDEVEGGSMAIRSPNGLRLIELRSKQHDQVCKHWEFLDENPPTSYMIPRTELTENDCGGMMIVDNKGIILRVGTLYDYSNVL